MHCPRPGRPHHTIRAIIAFENIVYAFFMPAHGHVPVGPADGRAIRDRELAVEPRAVLFQYAAACKPHL